MNQGEASVATILPVAQNPSGLKAVAVSPPREELDHDLQQAREQMIALQRQQEELERRKNEIEDLRRKQDEYLRGKKEMIERLTRGLVLLEREQVQAQRLVELCAATSQSFAEHLEQVQSLNDQDWSSHNLHSELSRALGIIANARAECNRGTAKIECLDSNRQTKIESTEPDNFSAAEFVRYLKIGAAASLPLIIAGTVWLVVLLFSRP